MQCINGNSAKEKTEQDRTWGQGEGCVCLTLLEEFMLLGETVP